MSAQHSDTIDLRKLEREIYESMPKERLVELAIEKNAEIKELREQIQLLKELIK